MSVEFSTDSKPEAAAIGSVRPRAGPDLTAECWFSTGRALLLIIASYLLVSLVSR